MLFEYSTQQERCAEGVKIRKQGNSRMKLRYAILAALCLITSWHHAIRFSEAGGTGLKHGLSSDYYVLWSASRAIMRGVNPYGPEVTEENQIMYLGATAKALGTRTEWRFPYPIYGTFPLFPLGLLDFSTANQIVFWLLATLTALSIGWLREKWDGPTVLYCALAFSTYPVIYALQGRQPTALFFGLAMAGYALLRSGRLVPAGMLAALAAGKPNVALAILLPMMVWTFSRWRQRKRFAISLAGSLLGLLIVSCVASPGWIPEWLATLPRYAGYNRPSLLTWFFGSEAGLALSSLVFLCLIAVLWLHRESGLLFQMSVSVTICSLLIPYQPYNLIVLLIPAVWILDNARQIAESGPVNQIVLAAVKAALILSWIANAVGALLWHTSSTGRSIAWILTGVMILPLFLCILTMMLVQLFSSPKSMAVSTTLFAL